MTTENNVVTDDPKMISIGKLAKRWDCSKHHLWEMARTNAIPAFKLGERWFIQMEWVRDLEGSNGNNEL